MLAPVAIALNWKESHSGDTTENGCKIMKNNMQFMYTELRFKKWDQTDLWMETGI